MKRELGCSSNEDVASYKEESVPEGICALRMK
jgi:hypothetical protein